MQPGRFDWLARQQVDGPGGALHAQAATDRCGYADADIALDEDDALLANHEWYGQRQSFPSQEFGGMDGAEQNQGERRKSQWQ